MIDERWCPGGSREERSVPVVVDSPNERPWWRRIDGAPPGMMERRDRPLTRSGIIVIRIGFVSIAVFIILGVLNGHLGLALWGLLPILQLLLMPNAHRRQILGRQLDR